jgi:diguanylate cyclase (GGDEF)-like protein
MGCFGLVSHTLQHAYRAKSTRWLIDAFVGAGMMVSVFIAITDQWVTPNITAYVLPCMLIGVVVYLRPTPAAAIYGASYLALFVALRWTQDTPDQLLSNRLSGLMACVMGWGLSMLLWRKFIAQTTQQAQLVRVNAELLVKQRDLERLTRLDGLTGLYNRNTFVELAQLELARSLRQGTATSILLLDLDHFKRVNDTWGHPAGDAVLKHVACLLNATVRGTDLVGRLGGEEFIILLPATNPVAARKLAEKVRVSLESRPTPWEGAPIVATASIGLAGTLAGENRNFEHLYTEADKALYLAKQRGRNQVI